MSNFPQSNENKGIHSLENHHKYSLIFIFQATHTFQNMYRPIPQSLSDSDSDKELQMDPVPGNFIKSHKIHFESKHPKLEHNIFHARFRKPPKKLSTSRKCLLVFSIFLCFFTIVVFLWVLPCTGKQICPMRIPNWSKHLNGLEFRGGLSLMPRHTFGVCFKNSIFNEKDGGGAVAISITTGDVVWYVSRTEQTLAIDCGLLDVNNDGALDCIIQKETSLEAVDSVLGTQIWNLHSHPPRLTMIEDVDMPIMVDDFDGDGVKELLTVIGLNGEHNVFVLLNGKMGMSMHEYVVKACPEIRIEKHNGNSLTHSCINGSNITYYEVLFAEFKKAFLNSNYKVEVSASAFTTGQKHVYSIGSKILEINKSGDCPNCTSELMVLDKITNKTLLLKRYERTLIMRPQMFSFEETKHKKLILQGHLQGYMLKLFNWPKDTTFSKKQVVRNMTVQVNMIKEHIVIITCNDTDIHVINASITDITQLCFLIAGTDQSECQPNVEYQDSIFVGDVDEEGSQDIINYSSSFVQNATKGDWTLMSSIQIFHLESELPKLFGTAK